MNGSTVRSLLLGFLLLLAPFAGCFGDDAPEVPDEVFEQDELTIRLATTVNSLPTCDTSSTGWVYFVANDGAFYICTDEGWDSIDLSTLEPEDGVDGVNGTDGIDGYDALLAITPIAASTDCPEGGYRVDAGLDLNRNGSLELSERDVMRFLCHGTNGANGSNGLNGADGLDGAQGPQGPPGQDGLNGSDGLDGADGQDGAQGPQGPPGQDGLNGSDGLDGADGLSALLTTSAEASGSNCANGGVRVDSGTDDNGNGVLDAGEIDATAYVCNGQRGANGTNGTDGQDGAQGPAGQDGTNGTDGVDGQDGAQGPAGQDGTNGSDGLNALVAATAEPSGTNCPSGGVRIDFGQDDDADGTLDASEVDASSYLCNGVNGVNGTDGADGVDGQDGAQGAAGQNGADGTNGTDGAAGADGLNSLVTVTTESSGSNCANGGQRIDIGMDDDDDGVLDSNEIDSTSYVCTGATGPQGPQGPQGPAGQDGTNGADGEDGLTALAVSSSEPAGTNCTFGGVKILVGIDDDRDGMLDAAEVDHASYVCNGSNGTNGTNGSASPNTLLTRISEPPAASNCEVAGRLVEQGLDNGTGNGTAQNGVLEDGEVMSSVLYCSNWLSRPLPFGSGASVGTYDNVVEHNGSIYMQEDGYLVKYTPRTGTMTQVMATGATGMRHTQVVGDHLYIRVGSNIHRLYFSNDTTEQVTYNLGCTLGEFAANEAHIVFSCTQGTLGGGDREPWIYYLSNGTSARLSNLHDDGSSYPSGFYVFGDVFGFHANDGSSYYWYFYNTTNATLFSISAQVSGTGTEPEEGQLRLHDGDLYFIASNRLLVLNLSTYDLDFYDSATTYFIAGFYQGDVYSFCYSSSYPAVCRNNPGTTATVVYSLGSFSTVGTDLNAPYMRNGTVLHSCYASDTEAKGIEPCLTTVGGGTELVADIYPDWPHGASDNAWHSNPNLMYITEEGALLFTASGIDVRNGLYHGGWWTTAIVQTTITVF